MIPLTAIVTEARSWIGTPYHHQARIKGVGVDCVGLPIGVARALGIVAADFDVGGYSGQPDGTLIDQCDHWMPPVARDAVRPGHIAVMCHDEAQANHLGVLADYVHGGLSIIHAVRARTGRGKVIEQRLSAAMLARVAGVYSLPGVA